MRPPANRNRGMNERYFDYTRAVVIVGGNSDFTVAMTACIRKTILLSSPNDSF